MRFYTDNLLGGLEFYVTNASGGEIEGKKTTDFLNYFDLADLVSNNPNTALDTNGNPTEWRGLDLRTKDRSDTLTGLSDSQLIHFRLPEGVKTNALWIQADFPTNDMGERIPEDNFVEGAELSFMFDKNPDIDIVALSDNLLVPAEDLALPKPDRDTTEKLFVTTSVCRTGNDGRASLLATFHKTTTKDGSTIVAPVVADDWYFKKGKIERIYSIKLLQLLLDFNDDNHDGLRVIRGNSDQPGSGNQLMLNLDTEHFDSINPSIKQELEIFTDYQSYETTEIIRDMQWRHRVFTCIPDIELYPDEVFGAMFDGMPVLSPTNSLEEPAGGYSMQAKIKQV